MLHTKRNIWLFISLMLLFTVVIYSGVAQEPSTIVFALEGSPPTFDPVQAADSRVDAPSINLYNALTQYPAGSTDIELDLATDVMSAEDGLSYTFTLPSDVMFHDGTILTAADVKYTVDRMVALNLGVARSLTMVTGADVVDDTTVIVNLSQSFPGFLGAMSRVYILNAELVQANTVDDDWGQTWLQNNDAGSGPYMLTSFTPEQQYTMDMFPEYFKGWEGNHVDRAIFAVIKEEATRRLALENGEADWILVGTPETFDALAENPAFTVNADTTLNQLYFAMNTQNEYLQDVRIRKALSMAYDYVGHVEFARNGFAEIARGPLPSGITCFDDAMQPSEMNIEAAKQLMADAGYPDGGFELKMAYQGTSPEETAAMQIMQSGAGELGISISPLAIEWPAKVQAYSAQETTPELGTVWMYPSLPDPDQFFGLLAASDQAGGGGFNFSWYSNPDMDELVNAGKTELDPVARCELYSQAQELWVQDTPYIDVVIGQALSASTVDVKGYQWSSPHSFTQNVYQMWIESS